MNLELALSENVEDVAKKNAWVVLSDTVQTEFTLLLARRMVVLRPISTVNPVNMKNMHVQELDSVEYATVFP